MRAEKHIWFLEKDSERGKQWAVPAVIDGQQGLK